MPPPPLPSCFTDCRWYLKFFGPYRVPYLISSHNRPFSDRPFSLSPTVEEDNLESCRGRKEEGKKGGEGGGKQDHPRCRRHNGAGAEQQERGREGEVPAGRQEGSGGGGPGGGRALCWRANSLLIAQWKREQTGGGRPLRPTERKGRLAMGEACAPCHLKPQARVVDAESIRVIS